jgi:hypothetical protein
MKHIVNLVAVVLLALASQAALAQAKDQAPAAAASTPAQADQRFEQMQEQMSLMQSQMEKIGKTQDPKERQRLLEEHWNSMQKAMGTMMMGGHMGSDHGMGGPMMWKDYRELSPEQLRERQYTLDRWMPMHQMMMDQMMQHQHGMMQAPPGPAPK